MQANLTILRYHGIWPTYLNGRKDKLYRIRVPLVCCALTIMWLCGTSHLANILIGKQHLHLNTTFNKAFDVISEKKQNVQSELLDDISVSLGLGGMYYILILFLWKRKNIAQLIQGLANYNKFGKPQDAGNVNDTLNFYTKLFYIYCIVGVNIYFILAQTVAANVCHENNKKFNRDEVCGFFTNMWLPFEYNTTPIYELLCAVQFISSLYAAPILLIPFTIFVMLHHMICKIRHLKTMAVKVFDSEDLLIQKKRLGNWICYHQDLIRQQME